MKAKIISVNSVFSSPWIALVINGKLVDYAQKDSQNLSKFFRGILDRGINVVVNSTNICSVSIAKSGLKVIEGIYESIELVELEKALNIKIYV